MSKCLITSEQKRELCPLLDRTLTAEVVTLSETEAPLSTGGNGCDSVVRSER